MATEGTKFQVNFKLNDGTLINLYATTSQELESQLAVIQDSASLIGSVSGSLHGAGAISAVVAGMGASMIAPPTPSYTASAPTGNSCKHGALVHRQGVSPKNNQPWQGYFCPSPKGTLDQCPPQFAK